MSWQNYPVIEAFFHIKSKTYPSFFKIFGLCFYGILIITAVIAYLVWDKLEIVHVNEHWLCLLIFAIIYVIVLVLCSKVSRNYGITWYGKVDFGKYAEYIVENYWKNIPYEIKHSLLRNFLVDAKNQRNNLLSEALERLTNNISGSFQKRYVIDCIFDILDNENVLLYVDKYLIPTASDDSDATYFLIEKVHTWSVSHRNSENILLYLHLLDEFGEENDSAKLIVYNLVNFIKNENGYKQRLNDLQIEGKCEFLSERHIYRIQAYIEAEENIKQKIEEEYKKKRKSLSFANSPSREDLP